MDLFEKWLSNTKSKWVIRTLTDNSYKKEYQKVNHSEYQGEVNTDLATYGDAIIKLCFLEILLDNVNQLTEEKTKYESDKNLVFTIGRYYNILKYIKKDNSDSNLPNDYDYEKYQTKNDNKTKYIATAVEAMIGAIYKETNDLSSIVDLLIKWKDISDKSLV